MSVTLNDFALNLITQLTRIADAAEKLAGVAPGSAATNTTGSTDTAGEKTESAADKKKRLAAEKEAKEKAAAADAASKAASDAPKADRAAVNKALVALKDTVSKEAAQEVYQRWNYTAMSKIEEKDFDAILAAAEQELADFKAKTGRYAEQDLSGDDDL